MIYIKKFIDRVALLDSRPGKDLIMPAQEAKMLRDEIAKLLSDKVDSYSSRPVQSSTTDSVVITGGTFK
jgi:hypothetical protein